MFSIVLRLRLPTCSWRSCKTRLGRRLLYSPLFGAMNRKRAWIQSIFIPLERSRASCHAFRGKVFNICFAINRLLVSWSSFSFDSLHCFRFVLMVNEGKRQRSGSWVAFLNVKKKATFCVPWDFSHKHYCIMLLCALDSGPVLCIESQTSLAWFTQLLLNKAIGEGSFYFILFFFWINQSHRILLYVNVIYIEKLYSQVSYISPLCQISIKQ